MGLRGERGDDRDQDVEEQGRGIYKGGMGNRRGGGGLCMGDFRKIREVDGG